MITDPLALRELDHGRFAIGAMLLPERSTDIPLTTARCLLPWMATVRAAIEREFDRYIAGHRQSLPNETIGVGDGFDFQLFDRALLDAPIRVSCWRASSTAWIAAMSPRQAAARSG